MSRPDLSVSPADTIRLLIAAAEHDAVSLPVQGFDYRVTVADCQAARTALTVLLAVGERDKAKIEQMHAHIAGLHDLNDELLAQVERDGRQIEQLTERDDWLLKQIDGCIESAEAVAHAVGLATARAVVGDLRDARAVLAGEKDAE